MKVRELRAGEAPLWRTLRLRALLDSPDAYQITYEMESKRSDSDWHQRIDSRAADPSATSLVAEFDGQAVSIAACSFNQANRSLCDLYAMWVAPESRRCGVGRSLLAYALDWMKERGAKQAQLAVTEANEAACALYASFGFTPTGQHEPLREGSPLRVVTMRRALDD